MTKKTTFRGMLAVPAGIIIVASFLTLLPAPAAGAQPVFKAGVPLMDGANPLSVGKKLKNGTYDFAGYFDTYTSIGVSDNINVAAPELVDWNNDGLMDLLVGEADGRIALFINQGTKGHPVFNGYRYLTLSNGKEIQSWLGGCKCPGGGPECAAPRVVDWNNDGKKDLLVGEWCENNNSLGANLFVYFNVGTDADPVFDNKFCCKLTSASNIPSSMPFATDWNGDGILDLISADNKRFTSGSSANKTINVFLGTKKDHSPASTYVPNSAQCELYSWNEYLPSDSFQTTSPTVTLTTGTLTGSRKSVVMTDWLKTGKKDLVFGMQDGTVWYSPNVGTTNAPVFSNFYQLQAGGSSVVVGDSTKVGQDPAYIVNTANAWNKLPAVNEARIAVADLDGDGLPDLVVGDVSGKVTVFYQYNPNPFAIDQNVIVSTNAAKNITLTAKVDSSNAVTYAVLSNPTNGHLTGTAPNLTYTPTNNYIGPDSFTFHVADGTNISQTATIHITVQSHAPVAQWTSPVTQSSIAVMNMNTSIVLTLTATDVGDDPLTYNIVTPPVHGTWNLSANQLTYTPTANYTGPDSFTYKASNGHLDSNVTTVNLDVCVLAVNFQPAATAVPQGYLSDTGAVFDVTRGYGWDTATGTATFTPGSSTATCFTVTGARAVYSFGWNPDPRMDSFALTGSSNVSTWACNLSNGNYYVSLGCGYKENRCTVWDFHQDIIAVQGNLVVSNAYSDKMGNDGFVLAGGIPVTVSGGQLTVAIGGAAKPTRLDYIEIRNAYQPAGSATFVTQDNTTQGNWKGVYGAEGYEIATAVISPSGLGIDVTTSFNSQWYKSSMESMGHAALADLPPYAIETGLNQLQGSGWVLPTTDARALQYPVLDTRIAACWSKVFAAGALFSDLNLSDGQTHRVALYCLDWSNAGWAQTIDILDAGDKTVLDSRPVSAFSNGTWMVWDITGHVIIRVSCAAGSTALISGIFFGISAAPSIYAQPLDAASRTGLQSTFSVRAYGSPLFYQWQRSNDGGVTWTNVVGATSADYVFATVLADNGAKFRCVVSGTNGSVLSNPATLAVSDALPQPPVITSPLMVTVVKDASFSYTIQAANNPTYGCYMPVGSWSFGTSSGAMSTPSACVWHGLGGTCYETAGTLYIPISAINAGGEDDEMLTVIVNPANAPVITSVLSVTGTVSMAFSSQIIGTQTPTSYSASGLPAGLTINTANGLISGTPTSAAVGTTTVMIGAQNANGTGLAYLNITILGAAPAFAAQPTNATVYAGQTATFGATVTGATPLWYQWRTNGVYIAGATSAAYTTPVTTVADNGTLFSVSASNALGSITSVVATLTVNPAIAPAITTQPTNATVTAGRTATFNVTATGSPLYYQWQKNGTNVGGATAASYTTPAEVIGDNGARFCVLVSNVLGSVTSANAILTVNPAVVPVDYAAYWKFDETSGTTAADFSGNGHTGTLQHTASWTTNGVLNGAATFTAATDDILVSPTVVLATNWTICAWFTAPLPATATWHTLVRANTGLDCLVITDGSLNLGMYDSQSGGGFRACAPGCNLGGLSTGWHHLAAVGAGTNTAFYLDGVYVGTSDRKGGLDVYALGNYQSGGQRFTDKLDDMRVYNRALNVVEIAMLTAMGVNTAPAISAQPTNATVTAGQTATFSVTASGTAPLLYQWRTNAVNIANATNAAYTTPITTMTDNGKVFSVVVSNTAGSVTSGNATLTVTPVVISQSAKNVSGGWGMDFMTLNGVSYEMMWRTNLLSGSWLLYTNLIGTGNDAHIVFTNAVPQGFFEIQVAP